MEQTRKLYQENVYQTECESRILQVIDDPAIFIPLGAKQEKGTLCLVLDQTVFFPEGGGQPSDLGVIGETDQVLYVFESEGVVYHQVKPVQESLDPSVKANHLFHRTVRCQIDWSHRFLAMQRHNGEHILSTAFFRLFGGINRGFHMGTEWMTIDIALPEDRAGCPLTEEEILQAEWEANRMIWDNLAVTTRRFASKAEAASLPMRKSLSIETDITLVSVGDENDAAGTVACCGTHPKYTGEVGLIKVYKWESYKGMTRITFDAGAMALKACQEDSRLLKSLSQRFSADRTSLLSRLDREAESLRQLKQELLNLKEQWMQEAEAKILALMQKPTEDRPSSILIHQDQALNAEDLHYLKRRLPMGQLNVPVIALVSQSDRTILLFSDGSVDVGNLVKIHAPIHQGSGGGKVDQARSRFPSQEAMDRFLESIGQSILKQ